MPPVRIALIQGKNEGGVLPSRQQAWEWTASRIREAASSGAKIICTQELFDLPYFCTRQDPALFDLAQPVPGPATAYFSRVAAETGTVLVLSLFEKRAPGLYHNTAAILDADGTLLGRYRKMHIPQDPGFEEKFYFTPGDLGFRAWKTRYGTIGVIICWDQWYPEASRITALKGAEIIFAPTAIGWLPEEKDRLGSHQLEAWLNVQKGHAVANGCYFAAANRVGEEGQTQFWGNSFVADYYGELIARGGDAEPQILYADCDFQALEEHRRMWPFFRDRRIDAYDPLTTRFDNED